MHWMALALVVLVPAILWGLVLRRTVRTQTRLIEERLQRAAALEARFRDLFEKANDMIFSIGLSGRFLAMNPACEKTNGYLREEAMVLTISDLVVPEDAYKIDWMFDLLLGGDESVILETRVVCKSQKEITLEMSAHLLL